MTDRIAERVNQVVPPAVSQMLEQARQLETEGIQLTYLVRGEPDFDTPIHISDAAGEALRAGHTHYGPTQGIPQLRRAVANRMLRDFGRVLDPDTEVIVTTGATMGIYVAVLAVVDLGDEVILFDPVYDPYPSVVRLAGGVPVQVPSKQRNGHFWVPIDVLADAVTARTKAILINNPWNPTGTVMTQDELQNLIELAEEHGLLLIVDEIYEKLTFDRCIHHSLAALSPKANSRTVTINSFSKTYAMTGWRLGYNIAPPDLTQAMLRVAQQFSRSAASFIQFAGVAALNGPQDAVERMVETYTRRRTLVAENLGRLKMTVFYPPEGTFFSFLDIRRYGKSSASIARYLLETAHVVTVAGSAYGLAGEGYIRLSFAYDEETLSRGLGAIARALRVLETPH